MEDTIRPIGLLLQEISAENATQTFHKETILLASNALERIPQERRDISTITATLSADGFSKLKIK